MFLHFFQLFTSFFYVCQSIMWLTYLLILGQYRNISCSGWEIFLKIFGDIPWMFLHHFPIIINCLYVCQSVSGLTSLLKLCKYRDITSSGWDIFLKSFGDFTGIFVHNFQIITNSCLSVSLLVGFIPYWN